MPSPGVSRFRRFRCDLDRPPAPQPRLCLESLSGVSLFWRFRCYLDRPSTLQSSPRPSPPPGVSLFRRFRCYLDRPPALHDPLRHPSLPGVSLFRCFGSHLRRVTRAPGPALWQRAHGNRPLLRCFCVEQEAARSRCAAQQDISGLPHRYNPPRPSSNHSPVPGPELPLACTVTISTRLRPVRGTSANAWNTAVRTRGVFTHRDDFQKSACVEKGLVRTGTSFWAAGPGLPSRIPSGSVRDPSARQRSGWGKHDRRGLAGRVGHEHSA